MDKVLHQMTMVHTAFERIRHAYQEVKDNKYDWNKATEIFGRIPYYPRLDHYHQGYVMGYRESYIGKNGRIFLEDLERKWKVGDQLFTTFSDARRAAASTPPEVCWYWKGTDILFFGKQHESQPVDVDSTISG